MTRCTKGHNSLWPKRDIKGPDQRRPEELCLEHYSGAHYIRPIPQSPSWYGCLIGRIQEWSI